MEKRRAETDKGTRENRRGGVSLPAFLGLVLCALASGCAFSVDDPDASGSAASGARETVTVRGVCAVAGAVPSELAGGPSGGEEADGASGARTALPAFDNSNVEFIVTFTAADAPSDEYTAKVTWDAASASGTYEITLPTGTYTASATLAKAGTSDPPFMHSDTKTVTVITSGEVAADFELSYAFSTKGIGFFALQLDLAAVIQNWECVFEPISGSGSGQTFPGGTATGGSTDLETGAYRATFTFYDANGEVCYWFAEVVNIFPGLTTSVWVNSAPYIKDNKITVTDDMVKAFSATTFYVDGSSGNDADNGSYFAPVKTVGRAVGKCSRTDGTAYTVYVAGATAETATISIAAGKNVTITQWAGKAQAEITPGASFGDESLFESAGATFAMEGVTIDGGGMTVAAVSASGGECSFSGCTFQNLAKGGMRVTA